MKKLLTYKLFENSRDNINKDLFMLGDKTLDDVKYLIEYENADVNYIHTNGETPLIQAVYFSKDDIVEYLISKGAIVNFQTNRGWTPIMSAHNEECFDILIKNGADVNLTNEENKNLLIILTKYDIYITITLFIKVLESTANLAFEDNDGNTFIEYISGNYKRLIKEYDVQKIIFTKNPELFYKFKKYDIVIDDKIKKEFPALISGDELNLL